MSEKLTTQLQVISRLMSSSLLVGSLIASCVLVSSLTACAPLLVMGGAATEYYVEKDERPVEKIITDAGITAAINAKYLGDPTVSAVNINVDTRLGVVTLYGSVSSDRHEDRAISLASQVNGVKRIVSKLTIVQ